MTTAEMIQDCIANPVLSMHHDWVTGEQAEYNSLVASGRRLYDNLRTKYGLSHNDAFGAADRMFGRKTF